MIEAIDPTLFDELTPEERKEAFALLGQSREVWYPLPGPQTMATDSEADVIGFGGAAGGGKTDFVCGKACTQHRKVGIFRENGTELTGIIDRLGEILGSRDGFNGKDNIWRFTRRDGAAVQIELGSFPNPGDEEKYRGRPHDFLVFDEAQNMRMSAVRFLLGWLRTTHPTQRCQAALTFNPPSSVEGRWLIEFFAPWLDRKHPNPAKPGELRWFATFDGKEREVDGPEIINFNGELVKPQSRTFIPSRVTDNPYLVGTNYVAQLQSLPEPLRSQMLYGDFTAGMEDSEWQVIPTKWVEAAMARWKPKDVLPEMDSLGCDIARRGPDNTVLIARHGMWFNTPITHPGVKCTDGPTTGGLIFSAIRNRAVVHIDILGVGAEPYGHLMSLGVQCVGVLFGDPAPGLDQHGKYRFANLRSQMWWRMREALDPSNNTGIALPPDRRLLADLCAPWFEAVSNKIKVASREDIIGEIGRSPDWGTAAILALLDTPRRHVVMGRRTTHEHDPFDVLREQHAPQRSRSFNYEHDPYS